MAICLVIVCGLLSNKKLKSVWSICFKSWHDGVGRTDNLYICWDSRSDLITVIFPKNVNFREDHILTIFWIFSKAGYILWHRTSDRSVVSEISRIFTTSWVHFTIGWVFMIQDECLMEPILMTSVLSKFIFNPLILEYSTKVFISSVKELTEYLMKVCVSSAYCLILIYFPSIIFIPSIFVLFHTCWANISAQRINMYGESGHPWRTPLSR